MDLYMYRGFPKDIHLLSKTQTERIGTIVVSVIPLHGIACYLCTFCGERTNRSEKEIESKWGDHVYKYLCIISALLMRIYQ